jgi:2,4-dienoyl-CoA reductase-like NADH-dependent reductase (Old Yellow Enzyme family)
MSAPKPMLFTPLKIRDVTTRNRIVISPMAMYCAENGYLNDFHAHHYAKFAMGGAGIVFVEQASVIREGRITNGCLGIWSDAHAEAMRSMVAFIKSQGSTPAIQIAHGGRKSSTQRAWEGNGPLTQKNFDNGDEAWTPVGPSSTPLAEGWLKPRALEVEEIHALTVAFRDAAKRAVEVGFEIIEIHMAHGYLLQSFLSPLANKRDDDYGGSLENRMRFPLAVARAVRDAIPQGTPLFVRISAVDWIEGGWEIEDSVELSRHFKEIGVDVIDCSSGGNLVTGATNSNLKREPGYQAEFARRIKAEVGIRTEAVGLIRTPELAEALLQKNSADLIAIGRQALFNPFWPHQAAEQLGANEAFENWPRPYAWWLSKWKTGLLANGESLNNWRK